MIKNTLILLRHGQSEWNQLNKFTGWYDAKLSKQGKKEAKKAGKILKKEKFFFDYSYTSMLKRAIYTLQYILKELDQPWIDTQKSWRLNERHYGALEGLNKEEVAHKYGQKKVILWRRSFDVIPPKITFSDKRFPGNDKRYLNLKNDNIPLGESLQLTAKRVLPYWNKVIFPKFQQGKKILIVAHGNSLRALIQHLYNIDNKKIIEVNIPTAIPIVMQFNEKYIPIEWHYLK